MSGTLIRWDFRKHPSETAIKATSKECRGRRKQRPAVRASQNSLDQFLVLLG